MKKEPALVIELEVVHPCINIAALGKVKDKDAKVVMKGILVTDREGTSHLFTLKSSKAKELLEAHKEHPLTLGVEVISQSKDRIDFALKSKPDIGIAHALARSRCISLEPVITSEETDRVVLFAPSWKAYTDFVASLPEDFECKIKRKRIIDESVQATLSSFQAIGFLELKEVAETFTERQLEVLNAAIAKGYYATPKRITMEDLADYLDISTPTLHEHLTKIEAKIMPLINRLMRTI
jgi:predicted DNA binding protein